MGDRVGDVGSVSARFPATALLAALLVLLQSARSAVGDAAPAAVDLTELRRNIIRGLKLDKLPDMNKVDIDNDEFHCKHLEYFRRLYADESERESGDGDRQGDATMTAADYDSSDVSAIQVRGRVTHHDGGSSPTDERAGGENTRAATITFPVDRVMVRGGGGLGRVTVIKSVVRVHVGAAERDAAGRGTIDVYARLTGVGPSERPSLVAAGLTWPMGGGGGRWRDVDVTRLFRRPRRRHEAATALELELRYPAAGELRLGGGGRPPVLHAFLEGALPDDGTWPDDAVRCSAGETKRKKRDGASGGGKKRRKMPSSTGRVRRTDCKADGAGFGNGTEPTRNKCCREQMRVVFADIPGFDFIAEPKWFDAGLCRGRCPAKYNPATRHAFIQSMMWKQHKNNNNKNNDDDDGEDDKNLGTGSGGGGGRGRRKVRHRGAAGSASSSNRAPPKPCCAPSKLDRLQIVHVDEADPSRLKVTTWEEMAVVECACS